MKKYILSLTLVLSLLLSACSGGGIAAGGDGEDVEVSADISGMDLELSKRDTDPSYNEEEAVKVTLSDGGSVATDGSVRIEGGCVTVTKAGTYTVSGSLSNGSLVVRADKTDKIRLVLKGVDITCQDGPAIFISSADKVFITLDKGSENSLCDGSEYQLEEDGTSLDAALFSREDLTVNGEGKLGVKGNYKHGIVSKDDLVITGGDIDIECVGVALNGKDCVKISSGVKLDIDSGGDGIRSDNEEDSTRGFVYISGGEINITSGSDAVQAYTLLKIDGGSIKAVSGGGSANASIKEDGEINPGWGGDWGRPGGGGGRPGGRASSAPTSSTAEGTDSAKGLKSASELIIAGGDIEIDSSDDSIHSNGNITVSGGSITASSGDDGMHADKTLTVSGGEIDITKSYEGIEGTDIIISDGKISVVASDDGLNAAGGNDLSSISGRPGQNSFAGGSGSINISGGYLLVNASGDGVDSNGTLSVSGGITLVSGPTNSGNGALDYERSAEITGGVFVAVGSSGMASGFSSASGQGAIFVGFGNQIGGTPIAVCDGEGKIVVCFTPQKAYSSAVVSTPSIAVGESYSFIVGGEVDGADENGFATEGTVSGGTTLGSAIASNQSGGQGGRR